MILAIYVLLFLGIAAIFLTIWQKRIEKRRIQNEVRYLQRQLKRNKKLLSESPIFRECSEHAISFCDHHIRQTRDYLAETEDPPWCQEYWVGWLRHLHSEKGRIVEALK